MKVKVWGARGSVPAPGPETMRYGGNTSCVQLTLEDGATIVLDAGTGIRNLGLALPDDPGPLHILLTHLHLDHLQGLMFFAPLFRPDSEIVIWGPASSEAPLQDRIARYISAPLTPVEVRELPCHVSFREAEASEWAVGSARVRATSVTHRGPTLGYRVTDGEASVCFIPDHEPGLGVRLDQLEDEWISGLELAHGASLLMHDCQYTDAEYEQHLGWGHTSLSDAVTYGRRAAADRLLLFHHDPLHSDAALDDLAAEASERWVAAGRTADTIGLAMEGQEIELASGGPARHRNGSTATTSLVVADPVAAALEAAAGRSEGVLAVETVPPLTAAGAEASTLAPDAPLAEAPGGDPAAP